MIDEIVGELLRVHAGGGYRVAPLPSYGAVVRKATRGSDALLVKLALDVPRARELLAGVAAQRRARRHGARVADVIAAGADVPPPALAFTIQGWVDGAPASEAISTLTTSERSALGRSLARELAVLPGSTVADDDAWHRWCADRLAAHRAAALASGNAVPGLAEAVAERCRCLLDEGVTRGIPVGLVHGDLHAENVIVRGGEVAALIDFDRSRDGDPLFDVVKLDVTLLDEWDACGAAFRAAYGERRRSACYELYEGIELLSALAVLDAFPEEAARWMRVARRWRSA